MNFYEIFDSNAIAAFWTDVNVHQEDPMIGAKFFPVSKKVGLKLAWIKGRNGLPVALQPSAFDTKATLRDRIGVEEVSTEMPFFREAMRVGEMDRQEIEMLLASGQQFAQATILKVFDDIAQLVAGADVQAERMRMSLLVDGKINITASKDTGRGVNFVYDFDVDGTWATNNTRLLAGTSTWTLVNKATSNPLKDIQDIVRLGKANGTTITRLLMNSVTFDGMIASESVVKSLNPTGAGTVFYTDAEIQSYIEKKTKVTIEVYDKMYKNEQGQSVKFYPDGYVAFLPSHTVGTTWYGTTPEEFDLLGGKSAESVSIVNTGVAITTIKEAHPVNVMTVVSEIVLPSFEQMDDVYVLKAF